MSRFLEPLKPIIDYPNGRTVFPDGSEAVGGELSAEQARMEKIHAAWRKYAKTGDEKDLRKLDLID